MKAYFLGVLELLFYQRAIDADEVCYNVQCKAQKRCHEQNETQNHGLQMTPACVVYEGEVGVASERHKPQNE